jgi:CBS domain-containing protein
MSMVDSTFWVKRMKAREIMTSDVVSARADTPVPDIARLLFENHISALPVLDESGTPIGIVSENDLVGRDETERDARRGWWLALLAEVKPLGPYLVSCLRTAERIANEIMSKPVVTVSEDTDTAEIARLFEAYRIRRVPVVQDGKMVGIVSRDNLLRVLIDQEPCHADRPREGALAGALAHALASLDRQFEHLHNGIKPRIVPIARPDDIHLTVADFRRLVADCESEEVQRREELRRSAAEQRRHLVAELIDRHISDDGWRSLIHEARAAAERGAKEFMLLRFPSQLCSDGGRAINAPDPDWPATLRGEAAEIYLRWNRDLKPSGFHFTARVVDYPDGIPGDIGLFLVWEQ